jgi:hypothetical protein
VDDAVYWLVWLAPRAILLGYTGCGYALGAEADDRVRARLEQRAKGVFPRVAVMLACGLVIFLPARGPQHGAWCRSWNSAVYGRQPRE